jgi:hypothetical protein
VDDMATRALPEYAELGGSGPYERQRAEARRSVAHRKTRKHERASGSSTGLARHAWWLVALAALTVSKAISTALVIATVFHRGLLPVLGRIRPLGPIGPQGPIMAWDTAVSGARGALGSWDGLWYLAAAEHGWPAHPNTSLPNTTGFFPVVPLTIRWTHDLLGLNWTWSGLVATTILEVAAVLAIAYLARRLYGDRVAVRTAILVAFFPGAYVFALIYSEPMFLLACAGCLIFLHRRQWVLAGLAGAVASGTRSSGLVLCLVCAWVAFRQLRTRPFAQAWSSLAAPVLAPLGMVAYLAFLWVRTGSPNTYDATQAHAWNQKTSFLALYKDITGLPHEAVGQETWVGMVFLVLAVAAIVLLAFQVKQRVVPSEWLVFSIGMVAVCLTSEQLGGLRPRFALAAFPLLIGLAIRLRGWRMAVVAGVFAAFLGLLAWTLPLYVP